MFQEIIFSKLYKILFNAHNKVKDRTYRKNFNIHSTARLNYPENIWFKGNIYIGAYTYI